MEEPNERALIQRPTSSEGLEKTAEVVEGESVHLDAEGADAAEKLFLRDGVLIVFRTLEERLEARGVRRRVWLHRGGRNFYLFYW